MSEGLGKAVHVAGAGLLAVFAFCGRAADDCGRAGVRGASMVDDGAQVGRTSLLADDAGRGATQAAEGLSGGKTIYGRPTFVDDGAGALEEARAGEAGGPALDVGKTVIEVAGELAPPGATEPTRFAGWNVVTERPMLLALLPVSQKAYERLYGSGPDRGSLAVMRSTAGAMPGPGAKETLGLAKRLEEVRDRNPIGLLLYADGAFDVASEIPLMLPNGTATDDAAVLRTCVAQGLQCVVLVCTPEPAAQRGACGRAARELWSTAAKVGSAAPVRGFFSALLDAREASPAAQAIAVSRLEFVAETGVFNVVRSRVRAPESSGGRP